MKECHLLGLILSFAMKKGHMEPITVAAVTTAVGALALDAADGAVPCRTLSGVSGASGKEASNV